MIFAGVFHIQKRAEKLNSSRFSNIEKTNFVSSLNNLTPISLKLI
ncbi:hypothetical protein SC1083_1242 [Aggregatibacter actinomycetemcomitans serotype e str. SC1083]|uniref:Uncharacterized protein n=1 Tax=Aggregatibacter actinomycetemcomitans serotype e str. SC1083 TaxID=907488 RepID=G4A8U0_AGGAC|nr:hypothetical protein SC1083_1242 [Aggregatibacter actinomycetemcomitans serotype e str. SC1083]